MAIGEHLPKLAVTLSTPSARRWLLWLWRSVCRLAPLGSFSRRESNETAAETESGFNGEPSGFAKSTCLLRGSVVARAS
jgi:hypothetical protein